MLERDPTLFKFDDWLALASEDPQRFEDLRRIAIERNIAAAPTTQQRRLRGLQWQIDCERVRHPNPLAACVKISEMMWENLTGPDGLLESLATFTDGNTPQRRQPPPATVLNFDRKRNAD